MHNIAPIARNRHLSPFRYPGGKTWLVPTVREWVQTIAHNESIFVEPFAGGATVGLTAAIEKWTGHVYLSELDHSVADVWKAVIHGNDEDLAWLYERIASFEISLSNVQEIIANGRHGSLRERAFATIVKNRMRRGGILAAGAGLMNGGTGGNGLRSRWYPKTIIDRIQKIRAERSQITFTKDDGIKQIQRFKDRQEAIFFIDPPYTLGEKCAGRRLYDLSNINHERLFRAVAGLHGSAMLTYDDNPMVRALAARHNFHFFPIPMKSTHHAIMTELVIIKK